jgi:hypothetical protein
VAARTSDFSGCRTGFTADGGLVQFGRTHSLKRTIPTTPAKFYSFREPRTALRARNDARCADRAASPAIQTAATRWRKVFAARRALKLRLDNLFNAVVADFDYSLVVNFAGARNAKDVLARNY